MHYPIVNYALLLVVRVKRNTTHRYVGIGF